jgi:hypothetical protein
VPLPELQRPSSDSDEPVPSAAYPIFITQREILVGSPPRSVLSLPPAEGRARSGAGAENKDYELGGYIVPLARALAVRTCDAGGRVQPVAVVHVDREMQYRVLIETLYTLSELGYKQLFIATRVAPDLDGRPSFRGVPVRARATAEFGVVVRDQGLWLTNKERVVFGRDCRALSPQPTSSSPSSPLSLSDIQRCVFLLSGDSGAVHLSLDGNLPVRTLMPLLNAFGTKRGAVSRAAIDLTGNLQTTAECVRAVAKTAQFQPPDRGSAVIVVPITFVSNSQHITEQLPCVAAPRVD